MKTTSFLFLCILWLGTACEDTELDHARLGDKPQLTYEVITNNDVQWNGEYNDASGKRVLAQPLNLPNGWIYTFQPDSLPFEMFIFAEANCACNASRDNAEDVIINFYVNDEMVKSDTNTWAKGVTSLLYNVE